MNATKKKKKKKMIKKCSCKHEYQDSKYGPANRVWTKGKGKRTCTVCGAKEIHRNESKENK